MKKSKRVGNRTATNFFISDFKLKSTEIFRDRRQRKSNNPSHQRYHNLFHDSRKSQRQLSNKKPYIEQLNFASATSADYFKGSKSVTKRSSSKVNENEKSRLERINNEMYSYIHGGSELTELAQVGATKLMSITEGKFKHRKLKTSSVNQSLKEKLQRSALQRFHQAATRQEEVLHQGVAEKKAEALFKFLREARMRHENRGKRYQYQQTEHVQDKHYQTGPAFFKHSQTTRDMEHQPQQPQPIKNFSESVPSSNKNISYQDVMASRPPLPQDKKIHHENIQREVFDQRSNNRSEESGSQVDFGQIQSSQEDVKDHRNATKNKPEPVIPQTKVNTINNYEKLIQEQKKALEQRPTPQESRIPEKPVRKESDRIRHQLPLESVIRKDQQPPKKQKTQRDIIDGLPEASTITPSKLKEQKPQKNQIKEEGKKQLSVNQHTIEKVLTTQYLEKESKKSAEKPAKPVKEEIRPKVLGAPPNLINNAPAPKINKMNYRPEQADDEIQQVQFQGNQLRQVPKKPQPPKSKPQPQLPRAPQAPSKPEPSAQKPEVAQPVQQSGDRQQESEGDALDALIFYIERIEDIGQYRMKSKDIYSDKSISKQLIEINKLCSYYMAHQFLYLTKQLHSLLTAPKISKDYYEILTSDLQQLRDSHQIDQDLSTLEQNMEQSKKLLQKCYKDAKESLPAEERILLLDGGVNYQLKCSRMLLKEFRIIYGFYEKKKASEMIKKRCCYLIEVFCVLKMFAGEEIKQSEEVDDIQDYDAHIEQYKAILLGK